MPYSINIPTPADLKAKLAARKAVREAAKFDPTHWVTKAIAGLTIEPGDFPPDSRGRVGRQWLKRQLHNVVEIVTDR